MGLHFINPVTFANGKAADLSKTNALERYGDGFQSTNPLGHAGGDGQPVGVPEVALDYLNTLIANDKQPQGMRDALRDAGHDGASALTRDDLRNLYYLQSGNTTFLERIATANGWRDRMAGGGVGGEEIPATSTSFKEEVEKELRRAGTEFHEAIKQAREDGVATEEQETEFLKRRLAMLVALNDQVKALPDAVAPGEPIAPNSEGQAECDALWDYIHEVREGFVRTRMNGYTVDPYWAARGNTSYFKSRIDEHLWNGLNCMSNVALVLGLRGKWVMLSLFGQPPRPIRDAYYISPFQSFASQDPVAAKFGGVPEGGGGVNVGSGPLPHRESLRSTPLLAFQGGSGAYEVT